jgi:hypothetical protein
MLLKELKGRAIELRAERRLVMFYDLTLFSDGSTASYKVERLLDWTRIPYTKVEINSDDEMINSCPKIQFMALSYSGVLECLSLINIILLNRVSGNARAG